MFEGCFYHIDITQQYMPKKGVRNLLTHVSPFSKERGC